MAELSLSEVEHIAQLARLGLSNEEKEMFRHQLSAILEYAELLNQLDTDGVPPTTSALPLNNVMRPDETTPGLSTEEALANAPDTEAGQFKVRPILE
jgi:aspartyl-tRNA(Asn)/glutamyl-tRNA(Gln) amidotransferase subunit C